MYIQMTGSHDPL